MLNLKKKATLTHLDVLEIQYVLQEYFSVFQDVNFLHFMHSILQKSHAVYVQQGKNKRTYEL